MSMDPTALMSNADRIEAQRAPVFSDLSPEDQSRANLYALLSRLYAAGPDRPLLEAIGAATGLEPQSSFDRGCVSSCRFGEAWDDLRATSTTTDAAAAAQEYVDLFVGVGKCEVNLHASHWRSGFMMEKPLAELRTGLALLGITRRSDAEVVEDHLSALCETMRCLVAGHAGRSPASVDQQSRFFGKHIAPWVGRCARAIRAHPGAIYYRKVAELTECFMLIEHESFALD